MDTQQQSAPDHNGTSTMHACILERTKQVRQVLDGAGPMPLANVARRITDATTNEVAMAVGWLAHAGEIRFRKREDLWEIALQNLPCPRGGACAQPRQEARG